MLQLTPHFWRVVKQLMYDMCTALLCNMHCMLSTILFSLISFDKTHFYGRLDYLIRLFFFGCIFFCVYFYTFCDIGVCFFFLPWLSMKWVMEGKKYTHKLPFYQKKNRLNIFAFDVNPNGKSKIYGNGGCSCCCCFCLTHTAGFFQTPFTFLSFFCGIILSGTMILHTYDSRCAK